MKFNLYHTCISVLDLDKSKQFYEEAFGLKEVRRIEGEDGSFILVFMGSEDNPYMIELTWMRDRKEPYDLGDNEIHVGFRVDDFDSAHKKHEEMGIICFENPAMGIYFVADPDGYWMEVVPTR